jgi:hypothetical protein
VDKFVEHLTKRYHKDAFAQIPIVFGSVLVTVALPRVSNTYCIDDAAVFIKSEPAVTTHVLVLSR